LDKGRKNCGFEGKRGRRGIVGLIEKGRIEVHNNHICKLNMHKYKNIYYKQEL